MLRRTLIAASESGRLQQLAGDLRMARAVAERFVAGDTLEDALEVTRQLNATGMAVTLDHLGEAVTDVGVAERAARVYLDALDRMAAAGLDGSVSVKPTHLGMDVSPALCRGLVDRIAERAATHGSYVMVDMEGSAYTQATVDLVVALRTAGRDNVGCAVQSYLHRTLADVRRLTGLGASLRLCKGAYAEPADIAYQDAREVDDNYVRCAEVVLQGDTYGRFATHDHRIIRRVRNLARRHQVEPDRYEFQLLHGVRTPLQRRLVEQGLRVRIYVPFGDQWYPYFVRRLAERPANLLFFLRALAGRR